MNKYLRIFLFGFLTWLVPFATSMFFYSKNGLMIDIFLFKSIMIVVGAVTGGVLLVLYFKKIRNGHLREGIIVGTVWFCVNIGLDLLVLVLAFRTPIADYFAGVGLRYLVIPVMSISIGKALADSAGDEQA